MKRLAIAGLFVLSAAQLAHAQSTDVQKAYKREFAFLEAEKGSLQKRLQELEQEENEKRAAAKAQVDQLQGSIMRSTIEADRLSDMMLDAERSVDAVDEGSEIVKKTIEQAGEMLEKYGRELPVAAAAAQPAAQPAAGTEAQPADAEQTVSAAQLEQALLATVELLSQLDEVRVEQGEFFAVDGKQVQGKVVRVGNVASFGVAEGLAGALAPAGGGKLKLWPEPAAAEVATAFVQGQTPTRMRTFVYETLDNSVEHKRDKTVLEVIETGGAIGWVLVGMGCIAALLIALRALLLLRAAANTEKLIRAIEPLLGRGAIDQAVELCRKSRSSAGRVLRSTLQNLQREREHLEDIISEGILHETSHLDRFGSTLLVLAAVAPLMGLLGTVTGMIATFDVITDFGTGNPKLLSGGISEALVTTELGLIVAIPTLLLGNLLAGWADGIKDDMDKGALRVVNLATGIRVDNSLTPPAPSKLASSPEPVAQA